MASSFPWQLYLFSLVNLVGLYGLFGDFCMLLTGSGEVCNSAEKVTSLYMSVCLVYVSVLFFVLTFLNHGNTPKLKRLAMYGANCAVAMFAGVIMTGSTRLGGFERSWYHLGDMVTFFALSIVLLLAAEGDSPAAVSSSPFTGLGINPKTLVLLAGLGTLSKLFLISDYIPLSYILEDESEVTDLARLFWNLVVVLMFEILLAITFALKYGDDMDLEGVTYAFILMTLIAWVYMIPILGFLRGELVKQGLFSVVVFIVICVVAIIGGRKQQRGYASVASVAT
jgi:hypothetical protein